MGWVTVHSPFSSHVDVESPIISYFTSCWESQSNWAVVCTENRPLSDSFFRPLIAGGLYSISLGKVPLVMMGMPSHVFSNQQKRKTTTTNQHYIFKWLNLCTIPHLGGFSSHLAIHWFSWIHIIEDFPTKSWWGSKQRKTAVEFTE